MDSADEPKPEPQLEKKSSFRVQFSLKALLVLMLIAGVGMGYWSNRPIALESSSIDTVQYNHWTGTLIVRFQSGHSYCYYKVPRQTYHELMNAKSHGGYFFQHIRSSSLEFKELE